MDQLAGAFSLPSYRAAARAQFGFFLVVCLMPGFASTGPLAAQQFAVPPSPRFARLPPVNDPFVHPAGALLQDEEDQEKEKSVEERIAELEKTVEELQNEKDEPVEYPTLEIGGRIHFDSWWFADEDPGISFFENPATGVDLENRIFFRRIRLELQGDIWQNMEYRFQIDFNEPQNPEYKDVYLAFTELPLLHTVIFGNHKRPLGLDHLNSSRYNVFMERPLVVEAFNEDARRIGVSSQGVSDDEVYNWRYGVWLLENTTVTGEYIGDSLQASFNARLASSPWYDETSDGRGYFHWAIAVMAADPDGDADPDDTNQNEARFRTRAEDRTTQRPLDTGRIAGASAYEILGWETILNLGPLQLVGEYQTNYVQRDDTPPGGGPDLHFHGGYAYVAYMLTGEHIPYDRESGTIGRIEPFENFFLVERCRGGVGTGWGAWQVALRYSYLDLTDDNILGGVENNVTLGLVWYFNPYANLQFNAIHGAIDEHRPVGGFTEGDFVAVGTRLRMEF